MADFSNMSDLLSNMQKLKAIQNAGNSRNIYDVLGSLAGVYAAKQLEGKPAQAQQQQPQSAQPQQGGGQWSGNVLDPAQSFFPMNGGGQQTQQQEPQSASPWIDSLVKNGEAKPAADFNKDNYQFLFQNQPRLYSHTPTGRLWE